MNDDASVMHNTENMTVGITIYIVHFILRTDSTQMQVSYTK